MAGSSGAVVTAARHLSRAIRRNAAGVRQPLGVMRTRGGAGWGLPLPPEEDIKGPVPDEFELWWGGEHVYDEPADNPIGPYEALGLLCCGLGFFAALGVFANYRAKVDKKPYPPREYPWLEEWDRLIPTEHRELNFDHPQNY